jgi:hypothetical protein
MFVRWQAGAASWPQPREPLPINWQRATGTQERDLHVTEPVLAPPAPTPRVAKLRFATALTFTAAYPCLYP